MYRIIYTNQFTKNIKNLKSCGLDKKARGLIGIMKKDSFQDPPAYKKFSRKFTGILFKEDAISSIKSIPGYRRT